MFNRLKTKASKKLVSMVMKAQLTKYSVEELEQIYKECRDRIINNQFDEFNTKEWCEILRPLIKAELEKRDIIYVDF